mmetsp:Transcript_72350/g.121427  ORF Transcript_72350/g.121427 Transcript_72350/m.121427 type:complete len:657 (-) Transcript_72350:908-2878(-)
MKCRGRGGSRGEQFGVGVILQGQQLAPGAAGQPAAGLLSILDGRARGAGQRGIGPAVRRPHATDHRPQAVHGAAERGRPGRRQREAGARGGLRVEHEAPGRRAPGRPGARGLPGAGALGGVGDGDFRGGRGGARRAEDGRHGRLAAGAVDDLPVGLQLFMVSVDQVPLLAFQELALLNQHPRHFLDLVLAGLQEGADELIAVLLEGLLDGEVLRDPLLDGRRKLLELGVDLHLLGLEVHQVLLVSGELRVAAFLGKLNLEFNAADLAVELVDSLLTPHHRILDRMPEPSEHIQIAPVLIERQIVGLLGTGGRVLEDSCSGVIQIVGPVLQQLLTPNGGVLDGHQPVEVLAEDLHAELGPRLLPHHVLLFAEPRLQLFAFLFVEVVQFSEGVGDGDPEFTLSRLVLAHAPLQVLRVASKLQGLRLDAALRLVPQVPCVRHVVLEPGGEIVVLVGGLLQLDLRHFNGGVHVLVEVFAGMLLHCRQALPQLFNVLFLRQNFGVLRHLNGAPLLVLRGRGHVCFEGLDPFGEHRQLPIAVRQEVFDLLHLDFMILHQSRKVCQNINASIGARTHSLEAFREFLDVLLPLLIVFDPEQLFDVPRNVVLGNVMCGRITRVFNFTFEGQFLLFDLQLSEARDGIFQWLRPLVRRREAIHEVWG